MELNGYQKFVLKELKDYVGAVREKGNLKDAWEKFWQDRGASVGYGGMRSYVDQIGGVPNACIKVPTGGGKTFIAANALKTVFNELPFGKMRFVLWLVPSDAILAQTTLNLQNPNHPYRQRLNADFGGRVNVYTKEELLSGQNFSPDEVAGNLSVCVFCYASIRAANTRQSDKKIYQENGNLMKFAQYFNDRELLLAETPETALIQVVRQLNPVVIVDESHNAKSDLSIEMLKNVNPSFILSMTATPDENANLIACVDARELKKSHMVKLPVYVYNRPDVQSVISDAVALQGMLEAKAKAAEQTDKRYIRPIVLFQAQPNAAESAETFTKIKARLVKMGVAADQIAIKTSTVDELKNLDLMASNCPVRFIITVNALKEGWDCPFAYILASLANKTSKTDVEQIVGRVLRQPYAKESSVKLLNMSFVMTSSNDFAETVNSVVTGLQKAGFSKNDYRVAAASAQPPAPTLVQSQLEEATAETGIDDLDAIPEEATIRTNNATGEVTPELEKMAAAAEADCAVYEGEVSNQLADNPLAAMGGGMSNGYKIDEKFAADVADLRVPQFMISDDAGLFSDQSGKALLTEEALMGGFTLVGKDATVEFNPSVDGARKLDIAESGASVVKCTALKKSELEYLVQQTNGKTEGERLKAIAEGVTAKVDARVNNCPTGDVKGYVEAVLAAFPATVRAQLATEMVTGLSDRIVHKIEALQHEHCKKAFREGLERAEITCEPYYVLPRTINPFEGTEMYDKTLYTGESSKMDGDETDFIVKVSQLENVKWWHRIIDRRGFGINAYRNIYPDFMIRTNAGRIVLVEVKGNHLDGSDAQEKMAIGKQWEACAGNSQYRYFMVFKNPADAVQDSLPFDAFLNTLSHL